MGRARGRISRATVAANRARTPIDFQPPRRRGGGSGRSGTNGG